MAKTTDKDLKTNTELYAFGCMYVGCMRIRGSSQVRALNMGREQDRAAALSVTIDHLADASPGAAWVVLIDGAIQSHMSGLGNKFAQAALLLVFPFRRATIIMSGWSAACSCQDPIFQAHGPERVS